MTKATRTFSGKQLLEDIRAGLTEYEMLEKYSLSPDRLRKLIEQLVNLNRFSGTEVKAFYERSSRTSESLPRIAHDHAQKMDQLNVEFEQQTTSISNDRQQLNSGLQTEVSQPGLPLSTQESSENTITYSLKLYGKTISNRKSFCTDLAAILNIDYREADELLEQVPVTIRSRLQHDKAERLRTLLTSIGALCLTVPDEEVESNESKEPDPTKQFDWFFHRPPVEKRSGLLSGNLKPSTVVLTFAVLALCIIGFYLVKVTAPAREIQMASGELPGVRRAEQPSKNVETYRDADLNEFYIQESARLETEIKRLTDEIIDERHMMQLMKKNPATTFEDLRVKDTGIRDLEKQLSSAKNQLLAMQQRLNRMNRSFTDNK